MTDALTLEQLIGQARALAGDHPCAVLGHDWKSIGGRKCPRHPDGSGRASQAVYACARCPEVDYGDPGGPGHRDCFVEGPCDMSCDVEFDEPIRETQCQT